MTNKTIQDLANTITHFLFKTWWSDIEADTLLMMRGSVNVGAWNKAQMEARIVELLDLKFKESFKEKT